MQAMLLPVRRRLVPVFTLVFLAPVIAEFLFGSTHFSTLYLLIVQMGGYGGAALLIREFVRRQGKGWLTILLLGIAFSIFEECVMLQSSLYPLFASDINHIYDRALGVNWLYLLNMLGYESVWAIVIPIQLTEMIFPSLRTERWLGTRGLIITAIVFLTASVLAWYSWTHRAVPLFYPHLSYQTPWLTIVIALLVIVLLVGLALGPWLPALTIRKRERLAPWPWLVGVIAFLLSLPWFVLIFFHVGLFPTVPLFIPFIVGLIWAAGSLALIYYWSTCRNWQERHRLALISGALVASMLIGFIASGVTLPIDRIAKLVMNIIAIVLLAYFAHRVRRRQTRPVES